MGASAWADTETTTVLSENYESYAAGDITATMQSKGWTFQSKNNKNQIKIVQGASGSTNETKYFDFYYPDGGASRNQYWDFGVTSSLNADNWSLNFSAALNPGANNSANKFWVTGTKSGNVAVANGDVTNSFLGLVGTAAAAVTYIPSIGATSYSDETITLTSGQWYYFTIKATNINADNNTLTLYVKIASSSTTIWEKTVENLNTTSIGALRGICWNSPRGNSRLSLDDVLITKEVDAAICADPSYVITGAAGTSRKFTLACETAGSIIYYATSALEKGADGWIEYTSEVTTDATTIYAYAAKGTTTSNIVSFTTGAGSEISLNAPVISASNLVANGDEFNAVFNASYNASGVEFTPAATLTATFTPKGGGATATTLPFTATEDGILTVIASAEGFTSAQTAINVYASYEKGWQSVDFSSLIGIDAVKAALGDDWSLQSGHGRWASWDTSKDGSYNFYQHGEGGASNTTINDNIFMREVVVLAEGMGLGRNVTGGEAISVSNTLEGDIVAFEIYNGYGKDINKGTNTHISYALSNGSDRPYMNSTNGALLVQATVYTPAKTTFTATYYNDNIWDKVYAYAYSTSNDYARFLGAWPGTELTATDGVYHVSFDAAYAPTTIIFNNGSSGEGNQTADYVFEDGASYNIKGKLHTTSASFTTNLGWEHVYAYAWSGNGSSMETQLGVWPGKELTATDGKYYASIFSNNVPEYIIFHNNSGTQTSDLAFEDGKAYTWNAYTVTFTTGWTNVNAWAWNVNADNSAEDLCGTWPGTVMSGSEGTFTYTYTGVKAPDMILFNNGTDKTGDFVFEDGAKYDANGASTVSKTISAAGYATYCSANALDFTGTGLTAYIAKKDDSNNVSFAPVTKVPANTGLLLQGTPGNYTISTTASTELDDVEGNALKGVTKVTSVAAGSFVLMNGAQGVGFYKTTAVFTVGANTAYIEALPTTARTFIGIDFDDTTGISNVNTNLNVNGQIYDLQGRRVVAPQKGLYIVNGKKVVLK